MSIEVKTARGLYESGDYLPGVESRNDPGKVNYSAYTDEDLYFGRLAGPFIEESDGVKRVRNLDDTTVLSDGFSLYSFDAIATPEELKYSQNEAVAIKNRGYIVVETFEDIDLENFTLSVVNGAESGQEADDIGKLSQSTGVGYSEITGVRVTRKLSPTLVEVHVRGEIILTPGS